MRHQLFVRIFVAILLVLTLVLSSTALAQDDMSTVTVTATADSLSAPDTLPVGQVTITYEASEEAPLITIFARLSEGVTAEDLMAGMFEDPASIAPQVTFKGSPFLMPGQSTNVTYNLEPGEYALINVGAEMPQVAMISVEGEAGAEFIEPEADVTVAMVDFGYGLPLTIPAGENVWRVDNIGEQWHEMAIVSVEPGTTLEDVQTTLAAGEQPGAPVFALMPMNAGETAWVDVVLEPGSYAIICNIPDVSEGSEGHLHHELGMVQLITVADTLTYEDPNGLFTLDYAAELLTFPDLFAEVMPFPNLPMADSQETADLSFAGEPLPESGWGLAIIFLPEVMFAEMGVGEDATILDIADAWMAVQFAETDLEIPPAEATTLSDGTEAAQIDLAGVLPTEDNLVVMYEVSDGVIALVSLLTATDGRTEEMTDKWWITVNSLEFTGTAEDMMGGMGGE